ncbi:ATP-binding protein [Usitatibacter palustris]|uniref:histidine kinase n=1 Tax=Usitatibacter palustris TaxID=2732487 RepID=A0A6M4H5U8_9PROT|nr:ATP-binding protein [Usitatibacter palustris]QJR14996.1 Sensor histidine kinase RcsC [Usitatibacter palustris]
MKMKLFPVSLLWQTLAVLVAALVLSQLASLWFLNEYVTRPRLMLGIGQFVSHLKTIVAALETLPEHEQREFIARVAEKDGLRIIPADGPRARRRFGIAPGQPAPEQRPPGFEQRQPGPEQNDRPRGEQGLRGEQFPRGEIGPPPIPQLKLAPDIPPVRAFRERVREVFGPNAEVHVRAENANSLWFNVSAGERRYWIVFNRNRIERDATSALIGWGVAGVLIALLAAIFIVWRLNRPLTRLVDAAGKLGRNVEAGAVPETGPSEIRAVARAFNQMKDNLDRQGRERATFLAGISHDLRTPLARLRLDLEMLGGKVEADTQRAMVSDIDDMNSIIDQFIDFARSEAAEPLAPVKLSDAALAATERAARAGANVRCDPVEVPVLMLRPLAVQRLIDNLVGNALKHAGGEVLVRTATVPDGATLSVLDRGPGIPDHLVERLKAPFTRRDEARSGQSGAGLGLAIASRIAAIHGGKLDLLARDGGGLEARVMFPAAR